MPAGHRFPMDKFSRLASLLETEGLPGPVIVNMLGKPETIRPR